MSERIWVLRDPSGVMIGASNGGNNFGRRMACRNAWGELWEHDGGEGTALSDAIRADRGQGDSYAYAGFTLTLEPHARPGAET